MNKLDILLGNNFNIMFNESIKYIGNFLHDFSKENIIIVPDKLSLITEQKIFEILNIEVYFNITVMGISKFAKHIIKQNGLNFLECTNTQSKLLTLKAIQNTKANFKCFSKNYTLGLADELFAKIEQIKSSNAKIEDLEDKNASYGTKLKFEDIKLVYNEYEKLRENRLDSGSLLSVFNSACTSSNYINNYNVFFIGFDSMTRQAIQVLNNVTRTANNTFISIPYPINQDNHNIYDKSFYSSVINMAKENNLKINQINCNSKTKNLDKDFILNNIFTRKKQSKCNGYVNIYQATNLSEEIDFVVKSINYNLKTKGLLFKDFSICCPQNLAEQIKSKLSNLDICSYTDKKISLINLEPVKYIIYKLKQIINPSDKDIVLQIINNEFFEADIKLKHELINLINQYSSVKLITKYANVTDENLIALLNQLKALDINDYDTVENYIKIINNFIINDAFIKKLNNFCDFLLNSHEINLNKIYLQIEDKLAGIFNEINEVLKDHSCSFKEFIEILEKIFSETEIAGVPSTINEVFIGDTKSFYGDTKYLYIIGAVEGSFPEMLNDTGLISDKEISSESIRAVLEPTTKIINKRNKFKALNILLSACEKCYISYHTVSGEQKSVQPSEFITELKYLFNINEINISSLLNYDDNNININKLCFNNVNNYYANINTKTEVNTVVSSFITHALIKNKSLFIKSDKELLNVDYKKLFFKKDKTSISVIEKYNQCPKSCFLANGLHLQRKKQDKLEANIIGSFIHEVAELFVKQNKLNLGLLTDNQIKTSVLEICNTIKDKAIYYSFILEDNLFIFNLIKNECIRFCSFLNYEQQISEFKPVYTEKYFGENSEFKPITITVDNEEYKISGIVDRIDVYDNYFRIIDYKSGSTNFKSLKDGLFYGTKLQLFVYAEAINQNIDKKFFGAFYLPIRNTFNNKSKLDYSYKGFFLDSVTLAQKCDNSLNSNTLKSNILNCALKKPKSDNILYFKKNDNIINQKQLDFFRKYAKQIVSKSIKNLKEGKVQPMPLKTACETCEFKNICNNRNNNKITREYEYALTNDIFMEFDYE